MPGSQVAGAESIGADRNEVGQLGIALPQLGGDDRAQARVNGAAGAAAVAGVHQVAGGWVVAVSGGHAAEDGQVLHLLGDLWQMFADLDAWHAGLDGLVLAAFLEVEGVRLGRPAVHPQQDAGLVLDALTGGLRGPAGQHAKPAGHRDAQHPDRRQTEQVAACHLRLVGTKHGRNLLFGERHLSANADELGTVDQDPEDSGVAILGIFLARHVGGQLVDLGLGRPA